MECICCCSRRLSTVLFLAYSIASGPETRLPTYSTDGRTAMPAIMAFKLFSELPQPTHCRSAGECVRTIDARASDRLVRTRQGWHIQ